MGLQEDYDKLKADHEALRTSSKDEVTALRESVTALEAQVEEKDEAEKAATLVAVGAHVTAQLAESKLPEVYKDRLKERFKESLDKDAFDAALKSETECFAKVQESASPRRPERNLGPQGGGGEARDSGLGRYFEALGATKKQAEIAAS